MIISRGNFHHGSDTRAARQGTFLIEGGITPHNISAITSDLLEIQTNLGAILKHQPFTGVSEIHLQNVHDQLSLEATKVLDLGSDALAPKEINDIQRDLIDIVQGNPTLLAAAGNGFAPKLHAAAGTRCSSRRRARGAPQPRS